MNSNGSQVELILTNIGTRYGSQVELILTNIGTRNGSQVELIFTNIGTRNGSHVELIFTNIATRNGPSVCCVNNQGLVDLWVMGMYGDLFSPGSLIINPCLDKSTWTNGIKHGFIINEPGENKSP